MSVCEGRSRQTGEPCRKNAVEGRRFCRWHGGHTSVGPANGAWKDGKYSRYLPPKLAERAAAFEQARERMDLGADVAALDARVAELMETLDSSGASVAELRSSWETVERANSARDFPALAAAMTTHGTLIRALVDAAAVWAEIRDTWQDKARMIAVDVRRRATDADMIQSERLVPLFAAILEAVKAEVPDPRARTAIANRVVQLMPVVVS